MIDPEAVRHETVLDNVGKRVSHVYAEALFQAADRRGQGQELLGELQSLVNDVFRRDPQLPEFLASAAIGRDRKSGLIRQAFEGRASEMLVDFLLVLNEHDRLQVLRSVVDDYAQLYDERHNRMRVNVRSAAPLADDQRERLTGELRSAFGKEPVLEARVDPSLLGGLIVQVDDWVYDSSVKTRLENIRHQLVERSSHAIQSGRDRFRSE